MGITWPYDVYARASSVYCLILVLRGETLVVAALLHLWEAILAVIGRLFGMTFITGSLCSKVRFATV